jgi:hypothetical protein
MPRRARRRFSSEPWSSNRRWPRFFARRSLATAEHVHGEAHGAKEIRGFHEVRIPYAHSEQTEMGETHVGIGMVKPVGSCHGSSRHPSDPVQDVIRRALAYFEQTVNVFLVRGRSTRLFGGQYVSIAFVLCHLRTCIWHSLARAGSKSRYRKVVRVQVPSPAPLAGGLSTTRRRCPEPSYSALSSPTPPGVHDLDAEALEVAGIAGRKGRASRGHDAGDLDVPQVDRSPRRRSLGRACSRASASTAQNRRRFEC